MTRIGMMRVRVNTRSMRDGSYFSLVANVMCMSFEDLSDINRRYCCELRVARVAGCRHFEEQ